MENCKCIKADFHHCCINGFSSCFLFYLLKEMQGQYTQNVIYTQISQINISGIIKII